MGDLKGVTIGIDVDAGGVVKALRKYRQQIALLTPQVTKCIICGKIKDPYGNRIRHFWYQKITAPIVLSNSRCKHCHWPMPIRAR